MEHKRWQRKTAKNKTTSDLRTGNRVCTISVAVIDTVVQRGGFKGEELTTIGQLRDQAVQIIQLCEEYQSAQACEE